ncbi:hypothetical protein ACJX0J_041206 [Zea mays]
MRAVHTTSAHLIGLSLDMYREVQTRPIPHAICLVNNEELFYFYATSGFIEVRSLATNKLAWIHSNGNFELVSLRVVLYSVYNGCMMEKKKGKGKRKEKEKGDLYIWMLLGAQSRKRTQVDYITCM